MAASRNTPGNKLSGAPRAFVSLPLFTIVISFLHVALCDASEETSRNDVLSATRGEPLQLPSPVHPGNLELTLKVHFRGRRQQ